MPKVTRRAILKASAGVACGFGLGWTGNSIRSALAAPEPQILKPRKIEAKLTGTDLTRDVLTYGDAGMPPVLRMKKGAAFAARLVNGIDEPTTIHWHGIRVPNKMDGVPFLVQPYVYTGDQFDYAFTPPDAGTFWYHPHCNTLIQMGHGLTGVIVVENPSDPEFDAEVVLNLRDWRLGGDGQFIEQYRPRDAARTGTFGTVRTANWIEQPQYDAPSGGLVRLRVAITDVTRIYSFRVQGADATVIAIDGNPLPKPFPSISSSSAPASAWNWRYACPTKRERLSASRIFAERSRRCWQHCARPEPRCGATRVISHRSKPIPSNMSMSLQPSTSGWPSVRRQRMWRQTASAVRLATASGPSTRCRGRAIRPIQLRHWPS